MGGGHKTTGTKNERQGQQSVGNRIANGQVITDLADPRKLNPKLAQGRAELQPSLYHRTEGSGTGSTKPM